jgi:hypothetical protein
MKPTWRRLKGTPVPNDDLLDDAMTDDEAGFFADLGLDDAPDNPNYIPDGKYHAFLFGLKPFKKQTDEGEQKKLIFTYKIDDPNAGSYNGKKVDVWRDAMKDDEPDKKAWLKRDLKTLGVKDGEMRGLKFSDIIGERVLIKIKNNNGFTNVNAIEKDTPSSSSSASKPSEPDF